MSVDPRITIIIPTRERSDVLYFSLLTAISQDYDNLEIVVCDNFSSDKTRDVVESFVDKRIRYLNPGKRLSMSHNWEYALSHVTGGWVTILGDDDGILPGSLQYVSKIIKETGVDAIRSNGCGYAWPSLLNKPYGRLSVSLRKGYEIRNSRKWLAKVMAGSTSYTSLPMLYNGGFVNSDLVKRAKEKTKQFYLSMTPDVYSSIAFSHLTNNYAYSYESLAINGASKHSGGSSAFTGNGLKRDEMTPAKMFLSEPNIPFHKDIPVLAGGSPPQSLQATVYESYLQALSLTPAPDSNANHRKQLSIIIRTSGKHRDDVIKWAEKFCDLHRLDLKEILAEATRAAPIDGIRKLLSRVHSDMKSIHVGSQNLPIRNVYEASIVAATIKQLRPSLLINIHRRILEKIQANKS
jgi:glycosyltransferase involved in cell wall biosynthesis